MLCKAQLHLYEGPGRCRPCRLASNLRAQKKYERTAKGRASHQRYWRTAKGMLTQVRYNSNTRGA